MKVVIYQEADTLRIHGASITVNGQEHFTADVRTFECQDEITLVTSRSTCDELSLKCAKDSEKIAGWGHYARTEIEQEPISQEINPHMYSYHTFRRPKWMKGR